MAARVSHRWAVRCLEEHAVSPSHPKLNQHSLPLVAAAIHDGHVLRPEVAEIMRLAPEERLREEDPYTARWTSFTPWRVIGDRSRFEVDLNRPPEQAVYQRPEDCWGLEVWKQPPPARLVAQSLRIHQKFYDDLHKLLSELTAVHGVIVVYDLHTYNHRREGAAGPCAPAGENPEINIGTGTMNRELWAPLVDRLIGEFREAQYFGRKLDVRENVRFQGGYFSKWIHQNFPRSAVSFAIEVKKFFMDEWTGQAEQKDVAEVGRIISQTAPGVLEELERLEITA